jgi:regulator of protease activity HflC (stomatin/prohibitin superfamily)
MTEIKNILFLKHLRSESNMHIRRFRRGKLVASGKGLAFWFIPMGTSIAELPTDDRELQFIFQGRSGDYQEVTIQGEIIYRVTDPDCLAERIDFSIDLASGLHRNQPLEQLAALFTSTAQKYAGRYIASKDIQTLVIDGPENIQASIEQGFSSEHVFAEMGLEMVSLGIRNIRPVAELEKAMQTPTRESIQQNADEATFQRRALAVEKERAIAENELQNRIELAVREEKLISQQGANERRRVEEQAIAEETSVKSRIECEQMESESLVRKNKLQAESDSESQLILSRAENDSKRLDAETYAQTRRVMSVAEAEATRAEGLAEAEAAEAIGLAQAAGEKERMAVYETLPANVVFALALQELAGKLQKIEHINITPDILQTNLADLFGSGAQALQKMGGE